jgi:hypothetical protein
LSSFLWVNCCYKCPFIIPFLSSSVFFPFPPFHRYLFILWLIFFGYFSPTAVVFRDATNKNRGGDFLSANQPIQSINHFTLIYKMYVLQLELNFVASLLTFLKGRAVGQISQFVVTSVGGRNKKEVKEEEGGIEGISHPANGQPNIPHR